MNRCLAWIFVVLLGSTAASGTNAQVFDPTKVGPLLSGALAELYLPTGAAPAAAVVVLHGCDGVGPHYREWARRLAQWGYSALLIDSLGRAGLPKCVIEVFWCRRRRKRATLLMAQPIYAQRHKSGRSGSA